MRKKPHAAGATAAMLDALAGHIDKVLDAHDDFGQRTRWIPTEGSPLTQERAVMRRHYGPGGLGSWDGAEADSAGSTAALYCQLTAQYLDSIRVLLLEREVMFSLAPLTRSVLEISGQVHWLLDTRIDSVRDRAARMFLLSLEDATRKCTTAKALDHEDLETLVKNKNHLRQQVLPMMFYPSEIRNNDGVIILRDHTVPGPSAALQYIEEVAGVDWQLNGTYAYLSNASHPTPYVVQESYVYDEETGQGTFVAEGGRYPYVLARAAILGFTGLWQIVALYHGFSDDQPGSLGEELDTLPAPEEEAG